MTVTRTTLMLTATALVLAGCGDRAILDSFRNEAGAYLNDGDFGNPTMNNTLVQTGQMGYVINLNERFAAAVPTMVNFAFNSAALEPDAQRILMDQAKWIRQFPEVRFRVYGHTDLVGSNAYNKRLGLQRARAAVNFLVAQGISRSRLEAVVSYGETQPLIVTQTRERRNRRTVTEVSGFVGSHPTVLNGKYAEIVFRDYVKSAEPPTTLNGGTTQSTIAGGATGG